MPSDHEDKPLDGEVVDPEEPIGSDGEDIEMDFVDPEVSVDGELPEPPAPEEPDPEPEEEEDPLPLPEGIAERAEEIAANITEKSNRIAESIRKPSFWGVVVAIFTFLTLAVQAYLDIRADMDEHQEDIDEIEDKKEDIEDKGAATEKEFNLSSKEVQDRVQYLHDEKEALYGDVEQLQKDLRRTKKRVQRLQEACGVVPEMSDEELAKLGERLRAYFWEDMMMHDVAPTDPTDHGEPVMVMEASDPLHGDGPPPFEEGDIEERGKPPIPMDPKGKIKFRDPKEQWLE
ncbi:MAG: hypothetical protein ACYTFG_02245 [Planctomycetota bacterium]|jgi:hypothetical protein